MTYCKILFKEVIQFFLFCGCIQFTLLASVVREYLESPCPSIFQYQYDRTGLLYGQVQIHSPNEDTVQLNVELSVGNSVEGYNGNIELAYSKSQVIDDIVNKRPILYKVFFPLWRGIPPKITKISVNGNLLCTGPKISLNLVRVLTTINLQHTLRINVVPLSSPTNDFGGFENTNQNDFQITRIDPENSRPQQDDTSSNTPQEPNNRGSWNQGGFGNNPFSFNPSKPQKGVQVIDFNPQLPRDPSKVYNGNPFLNTFGKGRPQNNNFNSQDPVTNSIENAAPHAKLTVKRDIGKNPFLRGSVLSQSSMHLNSNPFLNAMKPTEIQIPTEYVLIGAMMPSFEDNTNNNSFMETLGPIDKKIFQTNPFLTGLQNSGSTNLNNPFFNGQNSQSTPKPGPSVTKPETTRKPPPTINFQPDVIQRDKDVAPSPNNNFRPNRPSSQGTNQRFPSRDSSVPFSNVCGQPVTTNELVINGSPVPRGAYPWLVAMFAQKDLGLEYKCSGTLISNKHVVTAAHCVQLEGRKVRPDKILLILGKLNIQRWRPTDGDKMVEPEEIHVHPDYKSMTSDADIAVIVLSEEVQFNKFIRPICLWSGSPDLGEIVGQQGRVVGWGKDENGQAMTVEPKQTTLPIVSQEQCLRSQPQYQFITSSRTFCAGYRNGTGPCNGDSGSGFILNINSRWVLRGIVSMSLSDTQKTTCDLTNYVVFTDAGKYTDWLMSFLK